MTFSLYEAAAPVFVGSLNDAQGWLDKALAQGGDETALMTARLAPDMHAFPRQLQIASDVSKLAVARLAGIEPPAMPDTEADFPALKARLARTIAFIEGVDPAAIEGGEDREVRVMLPGGVGYRFSGRDYLTRFALPNFFFHVTTAYAVLRAHGVGLGKADFLAHLGPPNIRPTTA